MPPAAALHISLVVSLGALTLSGCVAPGASPNEDVVPDSSVSVPCQPSIGKWTKVLQRDPSSIPGQPQQGQAQFTPETEPIALRASTAAYGIAAGSAAWGVYVDTSAGEGKFAAEQTHGPTSGSVGQHNQAEEAEWQHQPGDTYHIEWNVSGLVQDLRIELWQLTCA